MVHISLWFHIGYKIWSLWSKYNLVFMNKMNETVSRTVLNDTQKAKMCFHSTQNDPSPCYVIQMLFGETRLWHCYPYSFYWDFFWDWICSWSGMLCICLVLSVNMDADETSKRFHHTHANTPCWPAVTPCPASTFLILICVEPNLIHADTTVTNGVANRYNMHTFHYFVPRGSDYTQQDWYQEYIFSRLKMNLTKLFFISGGHTSTPSI